MTPEELSALKKKFRQTVSEEAERRAAEAQQLQDATEAEGEKGLLGQAADYWMQGRRLGMDVGNSMTFGATGLMEQALGAGGSYVSDALGITDQGGSFMDRMGETREDMRQERDDIREDFGGLGTAALIGADVGGAIAGGVGAARALGKAPGVMKAIGKRGILPRFGRNVGAVGIGAGAASTTEGGKGEITGGRDLAATAALGGVGGLAGKALGDTVSGVKDFVASGAKRYTNSPRAEDMAARGAYDLWFKPGEAADGAASKLERVTEAAPGTFNQQGMRSLIDQGSPDRMVMEGFTDAAGDQPLVRGMSEIAARPDTEYVTGNMPKVIGERTRTALGDDLTQVVDDVTSRFYGNVPNTPGKMARATEESKATAVADWNSYFKHKSAKRPVDPTPVFKAIDKHFIGKGPRSQGIEPLGEDLKQAVRAVMNPDGSIDREVLHNLRGVLFNDRLDKLTETAQRAGKNAFRGLNEVKKEVTKTIIGKGNNRAPRYKELLEEYGVIHDYSSAFKLGAKSLDDDLPEDFFRIMGTLETASERSHYMSGALARLRQQAGDNPDALINLLEQPNIAQKLQKTMGHDVYDSIVDSVKSTNRAYEAADVLSQARQARQTATMREQPEVKGALANAADAASMALPQLTGGGGTIGAAQRVGAGRSLLRRGFNPHTHDDILLQMMQQPAGPGSPANDLLSMIFREGELGPAKTATRNLPHAATGGLLAETFRDAVEAPLAGPRRKRRRRQ